MSTDYKKVAETLLRGRRYSQNLEQYDAAIELCERMARGELVERERVAELKEALAHIASGECEYPADYAKYCGGGE